MPLDPPLLAAGIANHRAGRFEAAYDIYCQLLAANPADPTVRSLLGAACINLERLDEAETHLAEALRLDPNHHAAQDNLGVLLVKQGRTAEAIKSFRRAAQLDPNNAQTHLNLAAALSRADLRDEAIESYRRAAQIEPQSRRANAELARLLGEAGRAAEAIPHHRQIVRLKPSDPRAHFELAAALASAGQTAEAIAVYHETFKLKPDSAETCVNLAALYVARKQYPEAADWGRRALAIRPDFAEAHLNLATALWKLLRLDEATRSLREAIRLKPELHQAYDTLGNVLAEDGRLTEAIEQYRRAIELHPNSAETLYNWGIGQLRLGDPAGAIDRFDRALALRGDYAEAHHNRASALLLSGRMEEGLAEYEWRFRSADFPPFRPRWKLWEGDELAGRTIVLVAEQGLGDTLQFVRYARQLAALGARVYVETAAALHPLLARTPGVERWISSTEPPPTADGCVPMMSMPHRMQTTLETIRAEVPYIFADEDRSASWRERLAGYREFKVGIAWQGNPLYPGDRERSIPLAHFEPLARIPGVRLFSLQKGAGTEQLEDVAKDWPVVDFGEELDAVGGAFMDTAAIMRQLDLVITSDTATAHLAGALGVIVWVALQFVPDWRWLLDRADSPWYPTMRLFRQTKRGDWSGAFACIAAEVGRLVNG